MTRKIIIAVLLFTLGITMIYAQNKIIAEGQLTAEGNGLIAFNGSGTVTVIGKGEVFIVDRTQETIINIDSTKRLHHRERKTRGNTVHTYRRFDGTATIEGDDFAVVMDGINISLSISGTGTVLIQGDGDYFINGETSDWYDDGSTISLNMDND